MMKYNWRKIVRSYLDAIATKTKYKAFVSFTDPCGNLAVFDKGRLIEYQIDNGMIEYQKRADDQKLLQNAKKHKMEAHTHETTLYEKAKNAGTYFVLVTCRNSQDTILKSLTSIKEQTVNPEYVIVINDGSTDNTKNILDDMQKGWPTLYVIANPDLGYDISRVVRNLNSAIKVAREKGLPKTDYHMIANDDTVYPQNYAQKIISYMGSNPLVAVASGNYVNQRFVAPHGAGRFVRNSFFEQVWHGYYAEKMGFESAILYEARRSGYLYAVIEDIRFEHTRTLGQGYNFYEFGASMRTLGFHPLSVLVRFLKCFMMGEEMGRKGALYMLYYYLTFTPEDDGYDQMFDQSLRDYVRAIQTPKFRHLRRAISKMKIRGPYPNELTQNA